MRLLSFLAAHRPRGFTTSTPLIIKDTSKLNKQNNSISQKPPLAS